MTHWPLWWRWELEFSSHLLKRMVDRGFNETDLRQMLADASGFADDYVPGRYVINTRHDQSNWQVIVEPSVPDQSLIVITAYRVDVK